MPSVPLNLAESAATPNSQIQFRRRRQDSNRTVRRRPTPEQGQALEILGHAIEYLVDSELHNRETASRPETLQATQILMEQSRRVFAQCAEVVPIRERIRDRLIRMFGRPVLMLPPARGGYDSLAREWR